MRQTPVNDYLEEISTKLPEELYGYLSDAIYETVCEFDEEVAQLQAEKVKLQELAKQMHTCLTRPKVYVGTSQPYLVATECPYFTQGVCDYNSCGFERRMTEAGIEVDA